MPVKVFTPEEVNRVLPQVEETIRWLQDVVFAILRTQDALSVLTLLGAEAAANAEHEELLRRKLELEELVEKYNRRLDDLQRLGGMLKDLHEGLVDFYGLKDGRLIFLCWKIGEPSVRFWHEINAGAVGRRPVSEL